MHAFATQWKTQIAQYPQQVIDEAQQLLSEQLDDNEQAELHYWIALGYRYLTKMDRCLDNAYQAERFYLKVSDSEGVAKSSNLIGVVYFYNGFYDKSMRYFYKAKLLAEEIKAIPTLCRIENNIGEVYRETEEFEQASLHYHAALTYALESQEPYFQAIILENLGQLFIHQNDFDQGYRYLKQSRELLLTQSDRSALADVENKIGALYLKKGEISKAEEQFHLAFQHIHPDGNRLYMAEILINLAELLELYEKSYEELLEEAKQIALSIDANHLLKKIYERLSRYYETKQNFSTALRYYKLYHQTEQAKESSIMRNKLQLLRVELNYSNDLHKLSTLNEQLTYEIDHQKSLFTQLKQSNLELSEEIYKDELTKVYNRKGLFDCMRSLQDAQHLVVLLDIDYFKSYNDNHGHVAGDEALYQVAQALLKALQSQSEEFCVARMGGEEFLLIVPAQNLEQCETIVNSVRTEIEALHLTYAPSEDAHYLTISGGGLLTKADVKNQFQEIYHQIDQLLYQAKQNGRNQIVLDYEGAY